MILMSASRNGPTRYTHDFDIEFVKRKNNLVADALSRRPTTTTLCSMRDFSRLEVSTLVEYSKNQFACKIMDGLVLDYRSTMTNDI